MDWDFPFSFLLIKKMAMRKTEVLLVVNLLMDGWSG